MTLTTTTFADALRAGHLRCEYLVDPLGVGEMSPRLSWELTSSARGVRQSAYEIEVASSKESLEKGSADLWKSGKVASSATNQIAYAGAPLQSREACCWRVRSFDEHDQPSAWSDVATWEMGLLKPEDWQAKWIETNPQLRDQFEIMQAKFSSLDGSKSKDVTDTLRSLVKDQELHIEVNPQVLGGDPAKDVRKELNVRFRQGNQVVDYVWNENVRLDLPFGSVRRFYKSFEVNHPIKRARLFVTSLGLYRVELNYSPCGSAAISPDWTDYRQRVRYQVLDVTDRVQTKQLNELFIRLADGWFAGNIGNHQYQHYGKTPALLAQLEIETTDGKRQIIASDSSWQVERDPIIAADNMAGEIRSDVPWLAPPNAAIESKSKSLELDAQIAPAVRELMTVPAKSVVEAPKGSKRYVVDFGQNLVGVVRIKLSEEGNTRITLRHAEMVNADGSIYTTNLRGATATDTYFYRAGEKGQTYQPTFTYHGFRYVEVTGLSKPPSLDTLTAVVLGSDCPMNGTFECSDKALNQLQSNIQWGQRGNYLSVPTDCPQRDERQGWTGDAETFIGTAVYNADVAAFFSKWLVDLNDGQSKEGAFPNVAPAMNDRPGAPAWADAGTICPWTIYQTYGDRRVLEKSYPYMKAWVDWCTKYSTNGIRDNDRGSDFGDWLSQSADTSKELIGTAFYAHSTELTAKAARVLGHEDEAAKYEKLAGDIKVAFQKKFVKPNGMIEGDTQTGYALALAFDLLDDSAKPQAATHLAENVRAHGNHLTTGFVGVSHLLPSLAENGNSDVAYPLLLQDTFPSWLFSVKHGATTIWERWDGWTPEKGFQDPGMNSFNHYSLGSCGQWFYEGICGIRQKPGTAGFREIEIAPVLPPDKDGKPLLSWAKASYTSINGPIASGWKIADGKVELTVTIPANCSAIVKVPTSDGASITESGKAVALNEGAVEIGSGTYTFIAKR